MIRFATTYRKRIEKDRCGFIKGNTCFFLLASAFAGSRSKSTPCYSLLDEKLANESRRNTLALIRRAKNKGAAVQTTTPLATSQRRSSYPSIIFFHFL